MSQAIEKTHHYSARIPRSDYERAVTKCRKLGISMNTALIHALRDWCGSQSDTPIPVHAKLSEVIQEMIHASEARLIEALKPPVYSIEIGRAEGSSEVSQALEKRMHELQETVGQSQTFSTAVGTKPGPTRERSTARAWPEMPPILPRAAFPLPDQIWVMLGEFEHVTLSRAREILNSAGALAATKMTRKANAVLAGKKVDPVAIDAAESYGIPIWTETQFLQMAKFIGADVRVPQ